MSRGRTIAGTMAVIVVVGAALRGVSRRFEIKESSMSPALEPGDWTIAKRRSGIPDRGDIVVFDDPSGSGMSLVKRVIGLPGEQVVVDRGRVSIDGVILADRWANGVTRPDDSWSVPVGHVWVLGDSRGASRSDGRIFGAIPIDAIGWQIVARYWPRSRIAIIG
ncbi:MAG: signal peptidase I [Actinomycetota bacterium]